MRRISGLLALGVVAGLTAQMPLTTQANMRRAAAHAQSMPQRLTAGLVQSGFGTDLAISAEEASSTATKQSVL